ncbi:uncharacterized protein LOC115622494 [Scaptodrosophila lebanonensis]|uniref:Uncharacterized protein LOC115622494 n=1 Tax=Drosophila lebanonensis TaxID=7225 RepID=A0A6J2TAC7_DROLE|nr:uncharacterized protein LOC115622494 [Scaptodrosophila lebanonensis]
MACYSSTQMQACDVNSLPVGPAFSCPNGFVCTYGTAGVICEPSSTSASLAACQDCNKCDANNTFACTSTGTFALCLGTTAPQQVVGTCAPQYVCNINNPEICGQVTQGVTYCNVIRMPGNYPVGTNPTTTCKQYVKCWILNGSWYGQVYTCPGSTNFNIATRLCQSIPLPTQCSAAVVSLSLNGVELD